MPTHIISATELSRKLSTILNKIHDQDEDYEIKRGKDIIAQIIPVPHKKPTLKVSELNEFFKKLPAIEIEDQVEFEKDIRGIRAQNKFKDKSLD